MVAIAELDPGNGADQDRSTRSCHGHPLDTLMIEQIKFVSIPTRDQDRALDFYTTKLGLVVHTDQPFSESQRWKEQWGSSLFFKDPDGNQFLVSGK
jgi:hypothetical protein